jgi:RimJ/RimL family protein N-acetyltransferase
MSLDEERGDDAGRGPAYRIETERLVLRCWKPTDAAPLKVAIDASLDHLRPWMAWAEQEPEELQAKVERLRRARGEFDLGQDFGYGIFDRAEREVLGAAGLHTRVGAEAREIGYWIHKQHTNRGLATEAAAALTKVAFLVDGVARVEIHCDPANARSLAVPRKLGFLHEATLRKRKVAPGGNRRDSMIWTLLAEAFPQSTAFKSTVTAFDAIGRKLALLEG